MKKIKKYRTNFLYTTLSFFVGVGSIFNIAGNYFPLNYSKNSIDADSKAIESDWGMIGQDIKKSAEALSKKLEIANE